MCEVSDTEHDGLIAKLNNCDICESIKNDIPPFKTCHQKTPEVTHSDKEGNDPDTSVDQSDDDEYDDEMFEADDDDDGDDEDNDNNSSEESNNSVCSLQRSSSNGTTLSSISQRQVNKTFSSDALRDIERTNIILMRKILSNNRRVNQYKVAPKCAEINKVASSAINRRRDQDKIARDNQILLKKIQSVKPAVLHRK